jgi:predicted nucleic acid-binding protein
MLRVLLDTNIFCQDFRLRTSPMGLLLDESKRGRVQILVPMVVLQETTRRFDEEARKQRQSIAQQERALRRFGVDVKLLDGLKKALENRVDGYHSFLRNTLQSHGARFLDNPDVAHQVILDRVLSRRKPISEDGKRGYQDTLIWETILAERPTGDNMLYFITNNSSDLLREGMLTPCLRTSVTI